MERKRTKPYRVIDLENGDVWDFGTARAVADHLWTHGPMPLSRWAVYKHGAHWGRRGGEVQEWARALDAWQP